MYRSAIVVLINIAFLSLNAQNTVQYLRYQFTMDLSFGVDNENTEASRTVDSLLRSRLSQEMFYFEYFFNDEWVRMSDDEGQDAFYDIAQMKLYDYKNENRLLIDTIDLTEDLVWERTYYVDHYTDMTKSVLGFECYRAVITEVKSSPFYANVVETRYELYVTPEIKFPAFILCGLTSNILEFCALEVNGINNEDLSSYNILTAIKYESGLSMEMLQR